MKLLKLFGLLSFVKSEEYNPLHAKNESHLIICPKLECPAPSNATDGTVNPSDVCFSHDGSSPTNLI